MQFGLDRQRLIELMLYVAWICQHDKKYGYTKLNKILFYSDFIAFATLGHPITGEEYQKLERGPCARHFLPVVSELVQSGAAVIQNVQLISFVQKRLIPLRSPHLDAFTAPEIAIVDKVIDDLRHHNAKSVSGLSHHFVGWQAAAMYETIPYATALISPEPPDEVEVRYGIELAQRLELGQI